MVDHISRILVTIEWLYLYVVPTEYTRSHVANTTRDMALLFETQGSNFLSGKTFSRIISRNLETIPEAWC